MCKTYRKTRIGIGTTDYFRLNAFLIWYFIRHRTPLLDLRYKPFKVSNYLNVYAIIALLLLLIPTGGIAFLGPLLSLFLLF